MLSLGLIWCTFVALGDPFSSATVFWWSLHWSLIGSLSVFTTQSVLFRSSFNQYPAQYSFQTTSCSVGSVADLRTGGRWFNP